MEKSKTVMTSVSNDHYVIDYTNHRGETATRRISPVSLCFGESKYHKGRRLILNALDIDKMQYREFLFDDIHTWREIQADCTNCIAKRPDTKNCLPPALVDTIKMPTPCPAWKLAQRTESKPVHTPTFAELYKLPLKVHPKPGSPLHRIRLDSPRAGEAWTPDEDALLEEAAHRVGTNSTQLPKLATLFKRQVGGVAARLFKLGIISEKQFINSRHNTVKWLCEQET